MPSIFVKNAIYVDPLEGRHVGDFNVYCDDNVIVEAGADIEARECDVTIDARGEYLIPGLIDCHVHVTACTADLSRMLLLPSSYVALQARRIMKAMLRRGFTTVRDVGGADFGISRYVEEHHETMPSIHYCGKALSQTGGHGDMRSMGQDFCCCHHWSGIGHVCDGIPDLLKATRDEIRKGASHIKLMLSGGVASPTDHIEQLQFIDNELAAVVEVARGSKIYVAGHAYTSEAVKRAVELGVRTIEHGNLIDRDTIRVMIQNHAILVPTLVTYWAQQFHGEKFGMPANLIKKGLDMKVLERGVEVLKMANEEGLPVAFGTDLLGPMHQFQLTEFEIREEVSSPLENLKAATVTSAQVLNEEKRLGQVKNGYVADFILLKADPAKKGVLAMLEEYATHIVKNGSVLYKQ